MEGTVAIRKSGSDWTAADVAAASRRSGGRSVAGVGAAARSSALAVPAKPISIPAGGLRFRLSFPPSINHYWRRGALGGRRSAMVLSAEGRHYRERAAYDLAMQQVPRLLLAVSVSVDLMFYSDPRPAWDLDNRIKPVLDALQHGRVLADDKFVDRLVLGRNRSVVAPSEARVMVVVNLFREEEAAFVRESF